jgi:hypothetical protein
VHYSLRTKKSNEGKCMKILLKILCFLCMGVVVNASANDVPKDYAQRMQEIEKESYQEVDKIFTRIRTAIMNKENKSDVEWFRYLKDNELQYLLTEARIHSFDTMTDNIMIEKINAYLQKKIRGDMHLVIAQGANINEVKEFLSTSLMMCELSDGIDCKELINKVKNENRQVIDELKKQRDAQQKEACLARQNMLCQRKK